MAPGSPWQPLLMAQGSSRKLLYSREADYSSLAPQKATQAAEPTVGLEALVPPLLWGHQRVLGLMGQGSILCGAPCISPPFISLIPDNN